MADNVQESDSVAALLRKVGRRHAPPPEDYERVLAVSREAWRRTVRQRARRRWSYSIAASVALISLLVGVAWQFDRVQPGLQVGQLSFVSGGVFAGDTSGEGWRWISQGGIPMLAGSRLRTDTSGRASLRLNADTSLRVAASTDLLLQRANRVELLSGRVYFDVQERGSGAVEVVTRFGTLRDIGTQFEVLANADGLRVRTREGAVSLARAGSAELLECTSSEELRVDANGHVERGTISAHDEEWAWAAELAEPPRGDGLPLSSFLDWVARETGRRLQYDSEQTRERVGQVILHGTTRGLAPVQALDAALATTDIDYSLLDDGSILLRRRLRQ
jgi:ferric-dicitrate binding protein FerR (iron transport regulator)